MNFKQVFRWYKVTKAYASTQVRGYDGEYTTCPDKPLLRLSIRAAKHIQNAFLPGSARWGS